MEQLTESLPIMEQLIESLPTIAQWLIGLFVGLGIACEFKYFFFHRTTKKEKG